MDDSSNNRPAKRFCAEKALEIIEQWSHDPTDDDEGLPSVLSEEERDSDSSTSSESNNEDSSSDEEVRPSTSAAATRPKVIGRGRGRSSRARGSSISNNVSRQTEQQLQAWSEITEGETRNSFRFVKQGSTGVNREKVAPDCSELDCVLLLLDPVLDDLLKDLNDYGMLKTTQNTPAKEHSIYRQFEPVTKPEFFRFLAILCAIGDDPRDSIKSFWATKRKHKRTPWFSATMGRVRFESIYHTFLHAGGVDAEKQAKIEPFLERLIKSFQDNFYPEKNVCIDEMVIGYKGRWQYKQFNASKPSKYHIKTFGLCDSKTGYLYNVFTYYGSDTLYGYRPETDNDSSQAVKVFKKLIEPLSKGHHLYADRFYSSYPLLEFLRSQSFYYTGTVDIRRKNFPQELKTLHLDFKECKWFGAQNEHYILTAFRDKKAKKFVAMVSSNSHVAVEAVRTKRDVVNKPVMVLDYNLNMNGCDRMDQRVNYYGIHKRKSTKWWKKIFFWLLEIVNVNASILHRLSRPEDKQKNMSLIEFKDNLIEQLVDAAALSEMVPALNPPAAQPQALPEPVSDNPTIRLNGKFHQEGSFGKGSDRDCRVCSGSGPKRKRTRNVCLDCPGHPHLCKGECYRRWHTCLVYKM